MRQSLIASLATLGGSAFDPMADRRFEDIAVGGGFVFADGNGPKNTRPGMNVVFPLGG